MQYAIFEENLDRLEAKLKRIENKCKKYGADFNYQVVGEEFREVGTEDGNVILRFVVVEVSGFAKINDWEFVATIDHHEKANVIRQIIDVEIPEKYWTAGPVCEHCNTNRPRNDTYLVHNVKTGEFKQVGSGCLRDFTGGYDAELAAAYISMYDTLIQGESYSGCSGSFTDYKYLNKILGMSIAIITKMGYTPTSSETAHPTKFVLWDMLDIMDRGATKSTRYIVDAGVMEYFETTNNDEYIEEIKKYYLESDDTSSYTQNLKTIFSSEYCKGRDFGYIVSAVHCFNKEMEKRRQKAIAEAKHIKETEVSQYQGTVGQKITFNVNYFKCISAHEDMYGGFSFLFKFVDNDGNVYMWSTSKDIAEDAVIDSITGTVKKHEEYRGLKQTWVTRCKVTLGQKDENHEPAGEDVIDMLREMDKAYEDEIATA